MWHLVSRKGEEARAGRRGADIRALLLLSVGDAFAAARVARAVRHLHVALIEEAALPCRLEREQHGDPCRGDPRLLVVKRCVQEILPPDASPGNLRQESCGYQKVHCCASKHPSTRHPARSTPREARSPCPGQTCTELRPSAPLTAPDSLDSPPLGGSPVSSTRKGPHQRLAALRHRRCA